MKGMLLYLLLTSNNVALRPLISLLYISILLIIILIKLLKQILYSYIVLKKNDSQNGAWKMCYGGLVIYIFKNAKWLLISTYY